MRSHHDLFKVSHRAGQPHPVDDQLISALLNVTAPGILIIPCDRRVDLAQREPKARQSIRIDEDFILFGQATQRVHIREAWDGAQHRADDPVLKGP